VAKATTAARTIATDSGRAGYSREKLSPAPEGDTAAAESAAVHRAPPALRPPRADADDELPALFIAAGLGHPGTTRTLGSTSQAAYA
jgi:hypothetical protein